MSALPLQKPPTISDSELRGLLMQYRIQNWQGIQKPEWQQQIVDSLLQEDGESVLQQVASVCKIPHDARVLDIGSGVGSFVVACRQRGLQAFGVEPDRIGRGTQITAIQIATRRVEAQVFSAAVGERLPFRDRSFDLVTMNQVMEHVMDQRSVLREAARVLKSGGAIYIGCPNYLRFYEPHYKMFWFPLFPKPLGRLYLRLRGRNPVLLDQLTYTTNARLRALCAELGPGYEFVDLHREQFLRKCAEMSFSSRRVRLVAWMMRLPVVGRQIGRAALLLVRVVEGGCEMLVLRRPGAADNPC